MLKLSPRKLIIRIAFSVFITAVSVTIVNLTNPSIMREPNFVAKNSTIPLPLISWNNYLYSIALGAFSVPAAKMGEKYGLVRMAKIGIVGIILCSAVCGASRYVISND